MIKKLILPLLIAVLLIAALIYKLNERQNNIFSGNLNVYFVKLISKNSVKLSPVKRDRIQEEKPLKTALSELLKGPSVYEKTRGYISEIPLKTRLIGITELPDRLIINLSKEFAENGGSLSQSFRLRQLSSTAVDAAGGKPVYIQIESKNADYIGGEGVEVPQPLEKY